MTKITFFRNDYGTYKGFTCCGHSGYAEEGEDIVCAALSTLVINTINSIEAYTSTKMDVNVNEQTAEIKVRFIGDPDDGAVLLLKSLILGIQSIEDDEDTANFVDMIFEEV